MLISADFLPLKKTVVEYFYHTWIITGKRDLFDDDKFTEFLWKITELLINDINQKLENENTEEEGKKYGAPLNQTFKQVSDEYIYNGAFLALSAVIKLNLKFETKELVMSKLATTGSSLYYKISNKKEYRKNVLDVINTMYNSPAFMKHLDGIKHPCIDGPEEVDEEDLDGNAPNMSNRINRGKTVWFNGTERTRASILLQKLSYLTKNDDIRDMLEKEFEKMVIWFSDFSEN